MPIPDVDDMMLPALRLLGDGQPRPVRSILDALADDFDLSDEERGLRLPSGYPVFAGRARAALNRMRLAGLIESEARAVLRISALGRDTLRAGLNTLNSKMLAHRGRQNSPLRDSTDATVSFGSAHETTEEIMERAAHEARQALALELLARISRLAPHDFQRVVADVLLRAGYGGTPGDAAAALALTGDGGFDGLLPADRLGIDLLYVQARPGGPPVSGQTMRAFIESMSLRAVNRGLFIAVSGFTQDAIRQADPAPGRRIVLVDGDLLAELMLDHDVGVQTRAVYTLKQVDEDYFGDE